ncbi:hypothetical protein [Mycolicibacterium mageritense]|uniref:hypothetical protein n=1 Tax=Mycolicibacterium mageritense TaxID=53462 RepID=UPI001E3311E2|nr:hypothetical protein [Mycolicibacterium mageritense]GJJ22996.1 hypothetical protein MTY414_66690 [Mycolicibacterium mageritense]
MSEQLMIDFDPQATAARLAAEKERDDAYTHLIATVLVSPAEARAQGLRIETAADERVTVLVCPACGQYEVNEFLIENNHGIGRHHLRKKPDGQWVTTGREYGRDWCTALDLTSRHVAGQSTLSTRQARMLTRLRPSVRRRFDREVTDVCKAITERQHRQAM